MGVGDEIRMQGLGGGRLQVAGQARDGLGWLLVVKFCFSNIFKVPIAVLSHGELNVIELLYATFL